MPVPAMTATRRRRGRAASAAAALLLALLACAAPRGVLSRVGEGNAAPPPSEPPPQAPPSRFLAGEAAVAALAARGPAAAGRAAAKGRIAGGADEVVRLLRSDPALRLDSVDLGLVWFDPPAPEDGSEYGHGHGLAEGASSSSSSSSSGDSSGSSSGSSSGGGGDVAGTAGAQPLAGRAAALVGRAGALPDASSVFGEPALEDAFSLHSRPGAWCRIVLDFTGFVYNDTYPVWVNYRTGLAPVYSPPYDIDGDNSTFSSEERRRIIAAWRSVSEDYSFLNVDITTDESPPPPGRATCLRVVIGGTWSDWLTPFTEAGGVSRQGQFYNPLDPTNLPPPVYVFSANRNSTSTPANAPAAMPKIMAEIISHEVGHTLGLSHQGITSPPCDYASACEYYRGHGVWAPIMGAGYDRPVTQWARGEYTNASNQENAISIMSRVSGIVPDDHGDTPANATRLPTAAVLNGTALVAGAIERTGDADVFAFWGRPGGTARLQLSLLDLPASPQFSAGQGWAMQGANLNAAVTVSSPDGGTWQWQPAGPSLLWGAANVSLTSLGLHYVTVRGAGLGANASVGFSDYASLGRYALAVAGDWAPANLTCARGPITLTPPCDGAAPLTPGLLFSSDLPANVTPPLPAALPQGANLTFTVTSGESSCRVTVIVLANPCPPNCTWDSSAVIALPQPGAGGSCAGAAITQGALYQWRGDVTVTPPLPALFPPGNSTFVVANGGGSCRFTVAVRACPPPVCKWDSSGAVALPQTPGGTCAGAAIPQSSLFQSSGPTAVSPSLPALFPPGNLSFTVANGGGSCRFTVAVRACPPPACVWDSSAVLQPGGDCAGAVVVQSDLYQSPVPVTVTPGLLALFPPGNWSFTVANDGGGSCGFTVAVRACARCQGMRVKVVSQKLLPVGTKGSWRVSKATLRVTDWAGVLMPGAAVSATWAHSPAPGQAPAWAPQAVTLVTGKSGVKLGVASGASKAVPAGGAVTLTVTDARVPKNAACLWWAAGSDVITSFACNTTRCA